MQFCLISILRTLRIFPDSDAHNELRELIILTLFKSIKQQKIAYSADDM